MRLAALAIATLLAAAPTTADSRDEKLCTDPAANTSARIASCTRLVDAKPSAQTFIDRAAARQTAAEQEPEAYDKHRKDALADLDRAVSIDRKNPTAYLARAAFYQWDFNWKSARADLDRAVALSTTAEALSRRGDFYAGAGDHKAAIADYTKALERTPLDPPLLLKRAKQRWDANDTRGARDDYDRATEAAPTSPDVFVKRGRFLAAQSRATQALRDYAKALALQPNFAPAYAARGELHASHTDYKQAASDLTQALKYTPADIESRRLRALSYFALAKSSRAIADISEVIARRQDPTDFLTRAMIHVQKGGASLGLAEADAALVLRQLREQVRWDVARDLCKMFCKVRDPVTFTVRLMRKVRNPNTGKSANAVLFDRDRWRSIADAEALLGVVALKRGDAPLAGALIAKALRHSDMSATAHFARGLVRKQNGDIAGAKDDFAAADNEEASTSEYFAYMGFRPVPWQKPIFIEPPPESGVERDIALCEGRELAMRKNGMIDFAPTIDACSRAIRADIPPVAKARAYAKRAQWSDMSGKHDATLGDLHAALALDPNNVDALMGRGGNYAMRRQTAKALADFDRVISVEPKSFLAWFARCEALADAGELKHAVADCDRAIEVAGDNDLMVMRRALVLLRAGQYARAQQDYSAYLRELPRRGLPTDPAALYGRGLARQHLGDKAGAEADLKAASALDKNIERAYASLGLKP